MRVSDLRRWGFAVARHWAIDAEMGSNIRATSVGVESDAPFLAADEKILGVAARG